MYRHDVGEKRTESHLHTDWNHHKPFVCTICSQTDYCFQIIQLVSFSMLTKYSAIEQLAELYVTRIMLMMQCICRILFHICVNGEILNHSTSGFLFQSDILQLMSNLFHNEILVVKNEDEYILECNFQFSWLLCGQCFSEFLTNF